MLQHSRTTHSVQAPSKVVMIRPHHFTPNPGTAADNAFQREDRDRTASEVSAAAHREATQVAERLAAAGVVVHMFEDEGRETPDSCFPNNWFSTHAGGQIAIYPMYSPSRRKERRTDIIEMLKTRYRVQDVIDYSGLEQDNVFLEGTGAMVLDHMERVAYTARSARTSDVALERFCTHFNFEPVVFDAADAEGRQIYHTNVLMCVGTEFCLIGLSSIVDERRRLEIRERLESSGRAVVDLSHEQIANFAGNAIELGGKSRILALSQRAFGVLRSDQIATIEQFAQIVPLDVPTIELGGGSVRCMLSGIHLVPRTGWAAAEEK